MLVFSTCWNSHRHQDGEAMLDEILSLGFDRVELSHGIKISLLPGIMKAVEAGKVRVAGVHNFFPAPLDELGDNPDSKPFTADLAQVRSRALELTTNSMRQGVSLGARYVVLHMGTVEPLAKREDTTKLQHWARQGMISTKEFARAKGEFARRRNKLAPAYFARAREALNRLLPRAEELGIQLAVEGRSHYEQVPNEDEMIDLMHEFGASPFMGYWHDFGHIQRKHNLLLLNHQQFLNKVSSWLIGGHVNDVIWPSRDHQAPFKGTVPFDKLLHFFPSGAPLVWELSSRVSAEDIRAALELWRQKFPQTLI